MAYVNRIFRTILDTLNEQSWNFERLYKSNPKPSSCALADSLWAGVQFSVTASYAHEGKKKRILLTTERLFTTIAASLLHISAETSTSSSTCRVNRCLPHPSITIAIQVTNGVGCYWGQQDNSMCKSSNELYVLCWDHRFTDGE